MFRIQRPPLRRYRINSNPADLGQLQSHPASTVIANNAPTAPCTVNYQYAHRLDYCNRRLPLQAPRYDSYTPPALAFKIFELY